MSTGDPRNYWEAVHIGNYSREAYRYYLKGHSFPLYAGCVSYGMGDTRLYVYLEEDGVVSKSFPNGPTGPLLAKEALENVVNTEGFPYLPCPEGYNKEN